jgi:hypothetical protein
MSRLTIAGGALGGSLSSMGSLPGVQGYPLFKIKRLLSVRGGGPQLNTPTPSSSSNSPSTSLTSSTSSALAQSSSSPYSSSSLTLSLSSSLDGDWASLAPSVTIRLVAAAGVKNYSLMALACSNGAPHLFIIISPFYYLFPPKNK